MNSNPFIVLDGNIESFEVTKGTKRGCTQREIRRSAVKDRVFGLRLFRILADV